ncbi:MAG: CHASE3 domain-containing protein [Gemmatimonadaceae bacterium]|jgi:CHASE3 domain sensor protein
MKLPHSRPILISFGLASTAVVLCALLLLEWQGGTAAVESFEWVSHTLEIQRELATVEASMSEAESSQRGFVMTGNAAFLRPYDVAKTDVRARVANLRALVADNPGQLKRLILIDGQSRAKFTELDSTIKMARDGQREAAVGAVRTAHSDSLLTAIRSELQAMTSAEGSFLRARQKSLVKELRTGDMVSLGLAGALGVMMIALLVLARGAEHYRNLVTLCAWTRSVEYDGEWISFEEYLRRKFNLSATHGISPEALSQIKVGLDGQDKGEEDLIEPDEELLKSAS